MGQAKNDRRVKEDEALVRLRNLRVSPRKLNLVAGLIRGMPVDKAMNALEFSKKRISDDVLKALRSAVANAENNHGLDIDQLVVRQAYVGKALVMKRFRARGRGRAAKVMKPFSHLTLVVGEGHAAGSKLAKQQAAQAQKAKAAKAEKKPAAKEDAPKTSAKPAAKKAPAKKPAKETK